MRYKLGLSPANPRMLNTRFTKAQALICSFGLVIALSGCEVQRRRSDAELGLTPRQAAGRHIYDQYCERCHLPYSSKKRQGPSLQGVFRREDLPVSGMPANDDRVKDVIRMGRNKMDGFGNVLTDEQINDLLAYLHTL
jgi:mono/diheme cytochrome c family protein